jgi:hypothetical protein
VLAADLPAQANSVLAPRVDAGPGGSSYSIHRVDGRMEEGFRARRNAVGWVLHTRIHLTHRERCQRVVTAFLFFF